MAILVVLVSMVLAGAAGELWQRRRAGRRRRHAARIPVICDQHCDEHHDTRAVPR